MKEVPYTRLAEILSKATRYKSQQEIADWCGVSQPAVSAWLMGTKRPQPIHLANLAYLLDLNPKELAEVADFPTEKIMFLYESLNSKGAFESLELVRDMLAHVERSRLISPSLALEQTQSIVLHIKKLLDRVAEHKHKRQFLRLLAYTLTEYGRLCSEGLSKTVAVENMLQIAHELDNISKELKDDEILGLSYTTLGAVNYRLGRYNESHEYHTLAINLISSERWYIDTIRAVAVSSGQVHHKSSFISAENQIRKFLDENKNLDITAITYLLEGIGRGQSLLGQEKGWDTLLEARRLQQQNSNTENFPLRKLQLIRSQIASVIELQPNSTYLIKSLSDEGKNLSILYGFSRYSDDINKLLRDVK